MIDRDLLKRLAAGFGLDLGAEALERFDRYAQRLIETNKVMNLTAITEPKDIVIKHFADSLSLFSVYTPEPGAKIIDVGTGAGFPGLALLIARPDLELTLLDSTRKKLDFLNTVLAELGLNALACHARAEEAARQPGHRERYNLAAARAVANLRELCEYCLPFVKPGGQFIAMKGPGAEEELKEAAAAVKTLGGSVREVSTFTLEDAGERNLVIIGKSSQTSTKYPRASAQIASKPL